MCHKCAIQLPGALQCDPSQTLPTARIAFELLLRHTVLAQGDQGGNHAAMGQPYIQLKSEVYIHCVK